MLGIKMSTWVRIGGNARKLAEITGGFASLNGSTIYRMQLNTHLVLAAVLCLLPPAIIIHRIIRKRREHRALNQAPFKDLPRRPAGETLRIKLASLDDQGLDELLGLLLVPLMLVLGIIFLHPADAVTPIMFLLASALSSVIFGNRLSRILKERANYQLGFDGERFVGEELSRLIAAGFEIYHDVPFDGFNMDHVVVGPRGVFVVETKARRKPVNLAGKKEFRVVFDGKLLQWPWGSDGHGVDQAKNNAQTLAAWLSSAVGENIWVMPILTLPGWMVDRTAPSKDIGVLNPKTPKPRFT